MSYITPNAATGFTARRLQIAEVVISGQPAVNSYFTWHSVVGDNFDSTPCIDPSDSTVLLIDEGAYLSRATLAITRAAASSYQNYRFQFELDGVLIGKIGQTNWYNAESSDWGESDFLLKKAGKLKLKCIAISYSAPSLLTGGVNESRMYLWRSI